MWRSLRIVCDDNNHRFSKRLEILVEQAYTFYFIKLFLLDSTLKLLQLATYIIESNSIPEAAYWKDTTAGSVVSLKYPPFNGAWNL